VSFNREVAGAEAPLFDSVASVAERVEWAEANMDWMRAHGRAGQERAALRYRWDDVARGYADLAERLAGGYTIHGPRRRRRA
jgi:glycosyltransferase involved in cell wall biosynthesis